MNWRRRRWTWRPRWPALPARRGLSHGRDTLHLPLLRRRLRRRHRARWAQITGVRGDPEHPANFGRLCSKGSTLHLTAAPHVTAQVRALQPLRRAARGAPFEAVGWDAALDEVADRFASVIARHGPDAVGLYLSGQLLTEDYYAFNKLGKGLIGTNNVDTNSRLCMSSAVAGHKAAFGSDLVPACYEDLALAQTVFITGANMAWAHPVLYRRLEEARRANPALKLIVADPRRTETAAEADLHLQLLPGTDVVLHHALLHVMLWEQLTDTAWIAAHTTGFAALRDRVREFTPAHAAKVCGLQADDIVQAARWFANVDDDGRRAPTLSLWCQGLNQSSSGTDKVTSLINLHLACGQIGRPGAGPLSLTGQPNAMGGREVGGLATMLSAHRDLADPVQRAEVAALWGVNEVPAAPGKTAVEMFRAAAEGEIRALWIACTNPAHSMPGAGAGAAGAGALRIRRAAGRLRHHRHGGLRRPAAAGEQLGREGRHRHQQRTPHQPRARRRAAAGPGARRLADRGQRGAAAGSAAAIAPHGRDGRADDVRLDLRRRVWNEHRESTRGRDLDITGLSWAALDAAAAMALPRGRGARPGPPVHRRPLRHRRRPRPLPRPGLEAHRRAARRVLTRCRCSPDACATSGMA